MHGRERIITAVPVPVVRIRLLRALKFRRREL